MEAGGPKSFNDISDEIVVRILHFCDYVTILQFAATSHRYLNVFTHTTSLQLHIQLESSGLEIVGGSAKGRTNWASILKELRQYQEAWLDLDITTPLFFLKDDQTPEMHLWELREGLFFRGISSHNSETYPDSLQSLDFETMALSTPVSFKFDFEEFTVDPGQQLAVLVKAGPGAHRYSYFVEIHLRSTITGFQHPLAQHPILTVELDPPVSQEQALSIILEIVSSKLVIKFEDEHFRGFDILIWNWISGHFYYRISSQNGVCDFDLLDEHHLVLYSASPLKDSGRLPLQEFSLVVYDISISSTSSASSHGHCHVSSYPTHPPCLIFELPRIQSPMSISPTNFLSRSDPIPGRTFHTGSVAFASSHALTLGLSVRLFSPGRRRQPASERELRIFVSVPELLKHLAAHRDSVPIALPWSTWGERATRWFIVDNEPTAWICWLSGSRYISVTNTPDRELRGFSQLSVVDFNSPTVKRHSTRNLENYCSLSPQEDETARDGTELIAPRRPLDPSTNERYGNVIVQTVDSGDPTIIRIGFEEEVVSRLPYRIVTRAEPVLSHEGWLIQGDHVIGVNPSEQTLGELSVYKIGFQDESWR